MKKIENKSKLIKAEMVDGVIKVDMCGDDDEGKLYSSLVGVDNKAIFHTTISMAIEALPKRLSKDDAGNYVLAMLQDINPQDGLEAMLAAQMIATHSLSLEMCKRASLADQTSQGVNDNINRITKLQRTFVQQMEALQKKRRKGQVIQVQHVNVESGGQAVVGNISTEKQR